MNDDPDTSSTTGPGTISSSPGTTAVWETSGDDTDASTATSASPTTSMTETTAGETVADTGDPHGLPCQHNDNGFDVPEVCTLYAARRVMCSRDYAGMEATFEQYCGCTFFYAPTVGAECAMANEDYYACVSTLPCGENCSTEFMAWTMACGG